MSAFELNEGERVRISALSRGGAKVFELLKELGLPEGRFTGNEEPDDLCQKLEWALVAAGWIESEDAHKEFVLALDEVTVRKKKVSLGEKAVDPPPSVSCRWGSDDINLVMQFIRRSGGGSSPRQAKR